MIVINAKLLILYFLDIDDCAAQPCLNGGVCTDKVNGYQCSCSDGYAGVNCQTGKCLRYKVFLKDQYCDPTWWCN